MAVMNPQAIRIQDAHLNQIKSALGFPVVAKVHLEDHEIKEYAIWPALYQYFLKFPIPVFVLENQLTTETTIPYPDDETIGLLNLRTVGKTGFGQRMGNNSDFWRVVRFNQEFRGSRTRAGRKNASSFNPNGLKYNFIQEQQMIDAMTNNLDTFRHVIDPYAREVRVFSTAVAMLEVCWGKASADFDRIKPAELLQVIELSKAKLWKHLAMLSMPLVDTGAEKQINVDKLLELSEKVEEAITTKWNNHPDAIAFRMN